MTKGISVIAVITIMCTLFSGCKKDNGGYSYNNVFPVTNVSWNASPSELEKTHGEKPSEVYENSDDGGMTYSFDYTYEGINGLLRYTYNADESMIKAANFFVRMDNQDSDYNKIVDNLINKYNTEFGNPTYMNEENAEVARSYGWLNKEENIPLMMMCVSMQMLNNHVNTLTVIWYNPDLYSENDAMGK